MSDLLVYSAIFAGRDLMEIPPHDDFDFKLITDDEKYYCHTDVVVSPLPIPSDPRRSARFLKIMPQLFFPTYRRWIWIDGFVRLRSGTTGDHLRDIPGPLATFSHRDRNCAYQEAEICKELNLDIPLVIQGQMDRYREEGFPKEHGLGETMVLVRDNTPLIQSFNRRWWSEVSKGSMRDQLSFNYSAWKESIQPHYLGRCTGTPWFRMGPHAG